MRLSIDSIAFYKPPFGGLLFFSWLYFVLCFAAHPQSSIMHGRFIDPDDTMYALQSTALLDGQGWYDRTEHRLNPPLGVASHFSRVMELPYVLTIGALRGLTGQKAAIFITAAFWPPVFLLALLFAFKRQATMFVPPEWAGVTAFVALLGQALLFQFMPGHIDHHGFETLLIGLCLGCVFAMVARPGYTRAAAVAGALLALGLSIGLEVLPWLLVFSAFIGAFAIVRPEGAKSAAVFGSALGLGGIIMLPTYQSPANLFRLDIGAFSLVYSFLLVGIGLCMMVVWLVRSGRELAARAAQSVVFAGLIGFLFLAMFPDLLEGPYGGTDKALLDFLLPDIREATPMVDGESIAALAFGFLPMPVLSLFVCGKEAFFSGRNRPDAWILLLLLEAVATGLTLFYQQRYAPFAQLFSVLPLTFVAVRFLKGASPFRAAAMVSLMLFYPLGNMALVNKAPIEDVVFYPMLSHTPPCDIGPVANVLRRDRDQSGKPRIILAGMNLGMDLLFETADMVLSAPFHEDVSGNLDTMRFFRAETPEAAKEIVKDRGVDLIAVCHHVDSGYLFGDPSDPGTALANPFVRTLFTPAIPDWLRPVPLGRDSDVLLFQVIAPALRPRSPSDAEL